MPKNILILGGSGFVGRHVCAKLADQSLNMTVASRDIDSAKFLSPLPGVTLAQCDVHDEAALTRLVAGHDAVVNLVAILHGNAASFEQVHVGLPAKLARACAANGVRRLVHVSALGAGRDAPSLYLRSKAAGEQALRDGALDLTLLRPSVIFGAEDRFLNLFATLQKLLPFVLLARAQTRFQPVWVEDVAQAVVRCLLDGHDTIGLTYEACGPDVYTLGKLVTQAGAWAGVNGGRGRPVFPLPDGLGRVQATLMELTPGIPLMSRDNLDSMQVDSVATPGAPGLPALGIHASALAAVAPGYLGQRGLRSGLTAMRRSAGRF